MITLYTMANVENKIVIIFGPTASGKSDYAEQLAAKEDGVIINADSMQLYDHLRILTARPTNNEHKLYGVLNGTQRSNLYWWYQQAVQEIAAAHAEGKMPILVGGTGMYLQALDKGVASVPDIPQQLRDDLREKYAKQPSDAHVDLTKLDPIAAAKLNAGDTQRVMRALEVVLQTGRSITQWQAENTKLADYDITWLALQPERSELYERINNRFDWMLQNGAVEEVEALIKLQLPQDHQIMKAVGVREISSHLRGEITLEEAAQQAKQESRRYAKRQLTWLRNQLSWLNN